MRKKIVRTEKAPAAIGPYSQGIVSNGFLFTAGQIPLDPKSGEMVKGGMAEQTRRVFENLKAVLEAAGSSFEDVVKTSVYLTAMTDFPVLNEIYDEYLGKTKPARSTYAVAELPKGALVEIDLIARVES